MAEPITCNLAGNALDYLLLAGEMAQDGQPRMLKHAVATLADGLELLLKARLERYDWSLLFRDVDQADRQKFESGDFRSVRFDQTVKRLQGICGIEVHPKHLAAVNALRKLRNKIRHFAVTTDRETVVSLIVKAYGFAIDFTADHLEEGLGDDAKSDLDSLRRLLGQFEGFVDARLQQIDSVLKGQAYSEHIECPRCLQETLYPEDGEAACAFCGYRAGAYEAAEAWLDQQYGHLSPKDRMAAEEVVQVCPECEALAAIPLETDEEPRLLCLWCGESSSLQSCARCGTPTYGKYCDYCQCQMEKDD